LLKNLPRSPLDEAVEEDDDDPKLLAVPPDEVESEVAYSLFSQFCLIQFLRISVI
jgi:hypothetical protein